MRQELDTLGEVIGKAVTGRGLSQIELAQSIQLSVEDLRKKINSNSLLEGQLAGLEKVLLLKQGTLLAIQNRSDLTTSLEVPNGLECINTPFTDFDVNAYLLKREGWPESILFDSGYGMELAKWEGLNPEPSRLYLTHTDRDHVGGINGIQKYYPHLKVFSQDAEPYSSGDYFSDGEVFSHGEIEIEARKVPGHTPAATVYVIWGLEVPVAIVGDVIYRQSIGGVRGDYEEALYEMRRQILTLPEETLLAPGHGPYTTVREEKRTNPFFPECSPSISI